MKLNLYVLGLLLLASSQNVSGQEPGVKWRAIDWAARESTTGLPQSQSESGEDWWYDHKNVFNATGNHIGYIAAGFAQGYNREDDYEADEGGCYECTLADRGPACDRFETVERMSICPRSMLFEYDLEGNMKWCRTYNSGDFHSVIQANDGGFLAAGFTSSTRNVSNPNSWVSGSRGRPPGQSGPDIKELYYNPMCPPHFSDRL